MANTLLSKKVIVPAAIFFGGLLVASGILISANFTAAQSSATSQSTQWTQTAGEGVSVPACASGSMSASCFGGQGTLTLNTSDLHGGSASVFADFWGGPLIWTGGEGSITLNGLDSNRTYCAGANDPFGGQYGVECKPTPDCGAPPPPINYTVAASIDSGLGTITGPGISCPGDCSESYPDGTWVTLIATPSGGYFFTSWASSAGSICGGQGSTCSALIDADKTAGVNFSNSPPPFNYSLSNSGTSNVTKTSGDAFTTNTITKTLITGATESVTLSLSGVPAGVSAAISNQGCSPTCTSVITFTVPSSTPVGTYPITVTGSPLGKQTNFNLVVSGSPFAVSCSAFPSPAFLGQTVTWTAVISGGTPPFSYSWSGTNIPTNPAPNTNPFSIVYNTIGQKTAIVTVTDTDSVQASCPVGIVQIKFDPRFEEF